MKFINDIGRLLTQPILNKDTYKASHWTFEHPQFERSYAYAEARRGGDFKEVQFFGLNYLLRYYMSQLVTPEIGAEAAGVIIPHGVPFHDEAYRRLIDEYGGAMPLRIKAVPEGGIYPQGTPLVTVESLDQRLAGLASEIETMLLRGIWYPTTIATRSMRWNRLITRYLEESGTPETVEFKMVDFGARGVSSTETAGIGGMAHLVNFQVTDNLMGVRFAQHAYRMADMPGFSIPATEHSVTTSWGRNYETEFFRNILKVHGQTANPLGGRSPVSVVIDTYDQDEAIKKWLTPEDQGGLLDDLKASNMQVVLRPDSGDPIINVVHCLDLIGSLVGFTVNEKGYRVLPDFVRLIQGDGIHEESLRRILQRVVYHRWSVDNLVFGSGGGLLVHDAERDTHRFAMKTSEVQIAGEVIEVQKTVATDPSKASKKGRFAVIDPCDGTNAYETIPEHALEPGMVNELQTVWECGEIIREPSFDEVRSFARTARARPALER